ncbi:MAG: ferredoxin III, nif-specific [Thiohalomonadaceae bacterium]
MSHIVGRTRGGGEWVPAFITALDQAKCIGCGRCYKVCPRSVFNLVEREADEDEDEEFPDDTAMVMTIADAMDCIGCGACSRVCPKNCHHHEPVAA